MAGKTIIVANWKMHPQSYADAKRLLSGAKRLAERFPKAVIIVAPPALFMRDLAAARPHGVAFAAQDARPEPEGPFTGSISIAQAKECGASFVLVGHAERRAEGVSDDDVRVRTAAALAAKMTPIVCLGEKARSAAGEHFALVRAQVRAAFADVAPTSVRKVIVAYEPLWAIGKEGAIAPCEMHEMTLFIRKTLFEQYGEAAHAVRVLYGGSVSATDARGIVEEGGASGLLVGRASITPEAFSGILSALYHK